MAATGRAALVTYLRDPEAAEDSATLDQIIALTDALVDGAAGLNPGDPDQPGVTAIRLEVAARAYRNPNGYAGGQRMGDFTPPVTPGGRSGVYLTDEERLQLAGGPAVAAPVAWSGSAPYGFC